LLLEKERVKLEAKERQEAQKDEDRANKAMEVEE
jgi:hypothetical protein